MHGDTPLAAFEHDTLHDDTEAHVERLGLVQREIARRDGAAQWHTRVAYRVVAFLGLLLAVVVGACVVLAFKASRVQVFVQPVQLTDEGQMVLIGIPQDLLAYEPVDGQFMDLLAEWVRKRYWRGDDDAMKRTRNDWAWLHRHSCGAGAKQLALDERTEQPFKPGKKRRSIEIKSITKTATPQSYQVLWLSVSIDPPASTDTKEAHTSTFTVGRVRPKTLVEALDNRLGLCVSGYDTSPAPLVAK